MGKEKKQEIVARNQTIREAHKAGATRRELAARFGLTLASIYQITSFRLSHSPRKRERNLEIAKQIAAGVPTRQIAAQFGRSIATICFIARHWPEYLHQRRHRFDERDQQVRELYAAGVPTNEIAAQCDIPETSLLNVIYRHEAAQDWMKKREQARRDRVKNAVATHATATPVYGPERNVVIYKMYQDGATLQAIGDHFGFTRERARQIIANYERRQRRAEAAAAKTTNLSSVMDERVEDFELSVRVANAFRNQNIATVGDLLKYSEDEMLSWPNFGRVSLREVREVLGQRNLHLQQSSTEQPSYADLVNRVGFLEAKIASLQGLLGWQKPRGDHD